MLNHIFVPNSLICPNGIISFESQGFRDLLDQNFDYDDKLVDESEHYSALKAPYKEVVFDPNNLILPDALDLHQYFITTQAVHYPSDSDPEVPANSVVLRFRISKNADEDIVILQRYQTFFNYNPIITSCTQSPFDPNKDKCYIRPYGEWAVSTRIAGNSAIIELTDGQIQYYFKTNDTDQMLVAPAWFSADQVCARLYLSDSLTAEPIANIPASIVHDTNNGNPKIYLQLHTNSLPASFFVEVF